MGPFVTIADHRWFRLDAGLNYQIRRGLTDAGERGRMGVTAAWDLKADEYATLAAALDVLLPPEGSFPAPSECRVIEDFIMVRVPSPGSSPAPYPGLDAAGLKRVLARLAGDRDMTRALEALEREDPESFAALWALAVFGYYSRPQATAAIQAELAPGYHGAPLPLGYAHIIAPWDPNDPLQMPEHPRGSYIPTDEVRRIDLSQESVK